MKKICALFIMLCITVPPVFAKSGKTEYLRYYKKDKGFSIELPTDWKKTEDTLATALIAVTLRKAPPTAFRENINVAIGKLPNAMGTIEYAKTSLDIMKKEFNQFKVEKQGDTRVGSLDSHWMVFTHQIGSTTIKVLQYLFVNGLVGYAVTSSAAPDQFVRLRPSFEHMAESFRLETGQIADKK